MSIHTHSAAVPLTAENITLKCLTNRCHMEFPVLPADSLFLCFCSSLKMVAVSKDLSVAVQVNIFMYDYIPNCAKVGRT